MSKLYIPLHAHTAGGSVGDSILKVPAYVRKAKEYNLPAIALTEHGSMASMYEFYHECKTNGIKPIIGCEVYETRNRLNKDKNDETSRQYNHLVLIAKNNTGVKNLLEIVNDAQLNGFYYRPRTDIEFMKEHGEGIICLSACVSGRIPRAIINGDMEEALRALEEYQEAFDEVFLEIQPGNFEEQHTVNQGLLELAEKTGVPLVVTNDIHYLNEEDYVPHDAHVKIHRKNKFDDPMIYPDTAYWFMDYDSVIDAFNGTIEEDILVEAVNNTVYIAEQCCVELDSDIYMPHFDTSDEGSEQYVLAKKCFDKLEEIQENLDNPSEYMSRLLYELDTINKLGFDGYFLMVQDFINFAKSKGIAVGPGRGSVGGSLVAYLLGITVADPVKYGLLFERFLSVHRKSMPDCLQSHTQAIAC